MYPLNVSQPYPFNQWYVGAYGHEVSRTLLQRTLLNQLVVFYRTETGEAVALQGLCPHRFFSACEGHTRREHNSMRLSRTRIWC